MSDQNKITGRCLCEAVKVSITPETADIGICHCSMCRRWGSGPAMAIDAGTDVEVDGKEHVTTYRSSEWAERAFCSKCGTNLYYRIIESGGHHVCVGMLDDQSKLGVTSQIFIDEKPEFYDFANETKTMTGAEVFAMFAPPEGGH